MNRFAQGLRGVGRQSRSATARFKGIGILIGAVALLWGALGTGSIGATVALPQVASPRALLTSGEPFGIAVDASTGRAYIADVKENTLFVLDLATGNPIAYIPTGRQPNHVVLLGGRAFVSNFTDASITVIDTKTNARLKTLSIGGLGLAVNRRMNRLYAAAGSSVFVLDATTDKLVATLPAPVGANVWGVAVDPLTDRVYATDIASPRILVYDGVANTLVGQVAIDAPGRFGIAIGTAGQVFAASYTDKNAQLSIIDGASAKVIARGPISAFTTSLAIDAVTGVVHAASGVDRTVTAVDPLTGRALSKAVLTRSPGAVVIGTAGELLVVTSGGAAPPALPFLSPVPVVRP